MLFDQTAPLSSYWTPPQQASGFNKTLLALMGYNGNGTQNGWGKVSSWIPGFGAAANNSAMITARQAGLNDVASTIGEDTDNRMQKLQAGLQIAKAGVGAVTGNVGMINSGVQGLTQSVGGLMQANQPVTPYQGQTAYQRFAEGGKPKKPNEAAVRRGEAWAKEWFENRPQMQGADINYDAIPGGQFRTDRAPADKAANMNGAELEQGSSGYFSAMGGNHIVYNALPQGLMNNAGRAERSGGVHEMTHAIQYANWNSDLGVGDKLGKIGSTAAGLLGGKSYQKADSDATTRAMLHNGPIADSFELINNTPKKTTDTYLTSPQEVHARIMEWRHATGTKPNETITPELFKQRTDALRGKLEYSSMQGVKQLLDTVDEKYLPGLIDKTAYNQQTKDENIFRAADGGVMYPNHDKKTEDIVMYDKSSGEKVGEMRYNERIFDQQATKKMEQLADKGDHATLGKFVLAEMATHKDRKNAVSIMAFAGGGKLTEKPVGRLPERSKAQRFADQSALNRRAEEAMWQVANGYAPVSSLTGIQVGDRVPVSTPADRPVPILPDPTGNDIAEVTVTGKRTERAARPLSLLPEGSAPAATLAGMLGRVVAPESIPAPAALMPETPDAPATKASAKNDATTTDWLGLGSDVARGLTAAIGAAQPLPTRPVNPNLARVEREIGDRANEGLSAGERTNLLRQQADGYARDVQAIRGAVGGGGSAAAVLAAIGGASDRANAVGQQIEGIDRSQRATNQQNYLNDLRTSQAGSDVIFSQQYSQAMQNKAAYGQALAANIQNIADRQQYDKSYGKGSPYYNVMLELAKRQGAQQAFANAPVTSLPATL